MLQRMFVPNKAIHASHALFNQSEYPRKFSIDNSTNTNKEKFVLQTG